MSGETKDNISVTFLPQDTKTKAVSGEKLVHAARRAGVEIETPCGGQGTCGGCAVRITQGAHTPSAAESTIFNQQELDAGLRLSCQTELTDDLAVDTTPQREAESLQILTQGIGRETELSPALKKIELDPIEPSLEDQRADWERVKDAVKEKFGVTLQPPKRELFQELPGILRKKGEPLSIFLHGNDILELAGDSEKGLYGVALDMGTTTVVGYLLDLEKGKELAVASTLNQQSDHGHDLMSRITYAQMSEDGLKTLHEKGIASVNRVMAELADEAGISATDIYHLTVVGNTCMHHFLLELDPRNVGISPYIPVLTGAYTAEAGELGINVNPGAAVDFLPNVAGFVGADIVGVLLTTLIHRSQEICIALDIGTNGEIAVGSRDGVLVCSTAAGPAFEGARIRHGMRASAGAVHRVHVEDGALVVETVNEQPPVGICGSGLIDAAALLLNHGLMDESGRILLSSEVREDDSAFLKERLYEDGDTRGFIVAYPHESTTGDAVVITQQDIRELQLAKGAIFAGIQMLKKELGITDEDVAKIYLAGAFGNYLNPASAMRMGLIPFVPLKKVVSIGNAAGHGARLALLSTREMEQAEEIASSMRYIELAVMKDFQDHFIQAMNFPAQL